MRRHFSRLAAGAAVLLSLYACSDSAPVEPGDPDGGDTPGDHDGATTADGDSPGEDGATNKDGATKSDGSSADGGADAATDAEVDAPLDAFDAGPPPPPAVAFIGRFDMAPVEGPKVAFPAAQIIARFMGTEVKATFTDTALYNPEWGASRWEVIIDGVSTMALQLNRPQTTYVLATNLPMGVHTVELYKLTEASVGMSQFLGFDFSGGTLLAPPPAKTRHLEFLGDSASNGYGVECANNGQSFSAATENAHLAYPALIAADLDADHHNLAASGKGLYWNYYRPDTTVYSVIYPRTLPFVGGSAWNFANYTPDVVWMTLGGNDYSQPSAGDPAPPFATFQTKYDEMVTLIRTKHPAAHIFCAVAPSLQDGYPAGYNAYTNVKTAMNNVVSAHAAAGDTKIYAFEFTRSQNADLTACEFHPNAAKHRAMADEAIVAIKAKTGWP